MRTRNLIIGIAVSLICLVLGLAGIQWQWAGDAVGRADWRYLLPAGAAILGYLLVPASGVSSAGAATLERVLASTHHSLHLNRDIRDRSLKLALFEQHQFDLVVHSAARPAHDTAAHLPPVDFEVNALGQA